MTKFITRKPHPARRARIATATLSSTAFLTIISSFAWNSYVAELAASSTPIAPEVPAATVTDPTAVTAPSTATAPVVAVSTAPAPTATSAPTKKKSQSATTTAPAATAVVPATPTAAPVAPAAPTVLYTCISPSSGYQKRPHGQTCPSGYVLTQI